MSVQETLQTNWIAAISFIAYLIVVVGVGIFATRFSSAGISEFFIGGRKMNRFVVALSAVVSGRSAWLLLGVTGMAYKMGAAAAWAVTGYIIVELFLFLFYARRLRRFSEQYDCITLPDFFAIRFGDKNGALRITLTSVIIIFMLSYVSAQFVGGGKAFSAGFGINQTSGIFITAAIVLIYTMLGGFLAVSITDMIQALFMIISLIVLPFIAIADRGGLSSILLQLSEIDLTLIDPFALAAGVGIGFLGIGLGSPGNPHIIARYMSIENSEQLRTSALVGTIWNVCMAWGALFIGLAGRVYFPNIDMLPAADTEQLYPYLAQQLLNPVLFGIVIASIFAAIMSTADSQLLVAASGIVRDIYEKVLHGRDPVSQKHLVFLSRLVVFILVVIALLLGLIASDLVFWLVLFAWAGLGAALGPTSILALYWRGTTRSGIFAGLSTGTLATIIWYYTPVLKSIIYELVPAFILGTISTIVVSRLTSPPEKTELFFDVMRLKK
jgi:SSS family solute:Na+ symporter